ncbi:DUF4221 family protein [Aquirufa aurantiipilula]|uniref:DUF4221 family protein n=1 Tax=Aquirufa aurantiipilula TaxID=2696561 RepID=A0ABT6BLV7_9BACT|nr:DUF4221 family protein [Aquirufa aurantiipilula]MDF5691464.1 DUF4221 family protein [Aquirufa aurantiipilula]
MRIRFYISIWTVSLTVILGSCNQSSFDKESFLNDILIIKYDSLEMPVDSTISAVGNYNHVYQKDAKGESYLVVSNLNNELVYFNLDRRKIVKRIKFQQEGPHGIGYIGNFNFYSEDTIVLKGLNPLETYSLNTGAKKISTFSTSKFAGFQAREILGQPTTSISIYDQYVIQFTQALLLRDLSSNRKYFDLNSKAFALLDLTNGEYTFLPIKFPITMHDKKEFWDLFHITPSSAIIQDKFYYTFPGSDSLYFYNINTKQVKQVSAPSIHSVHGNGVVVRKFTSLEEYFDVYAQNMSYVKILADGNNNRIIRFIAHPTKKWKNSGNLNDVLISKPFSIQIFDSDLNLLGETDVFFDNLYDFLDSFVGEKGLYISNNHPENAKIDERFLSYSIFKIGK